MNKLKEFVKSAIIGGILVILPLAIFLATLTWVFNLIRKTITPLTAIVSQKAHIQGIIADSITITLIVFVCFFVGALVRTKLGKWVYSTLELQVLKKIPGYSLIKGTVFQFLDKNNAPFSSVALVQIFGNETLVSAFITDNHENGTSTVFVPTGPNPTSGNIYHLPQKYVHPIDASVEDVMKSIISCGAGSSALIKKQESLPNNKDVVKQSFIKTKKES